MTVMAAGGTRAATAARSSSPRSPATRQPARFTGPRPLPPPRQPRRTRQPAAPRNPARDAAGDFYRRQATQSRGGSLSDYQPVILAEFVAAILLVALSPIASRQTGRTPQGQVGLSPYTGGDMVQLGAITMTYLILALISTGPRGAGRASAWFGGLILLALGLVKTGTIAKVLDLFGAGGPPPAGVEAGGQPLAPLAGGGIEAGGGPVLPQGG